MHKPLSKCQTRKKHVVFDYIYTKEDPTLANIKSAKKRVITSAKRAELNKAVKSGVKTATKKVYAAIESGDKNAASAALTSAISTIEKAGSKGVYHKCTTSRKVSRLTKAVNKMA